MSLSRCAAVAALFAACVSLHATTAAIATPLAPGATVTPLLGSYSGASLGQKTFSNASFGFVETVYADAANPLCPSCLEFVISAVNNNVPSTSSGVEVQSVSTEDFAGFATDVAFSMPSPDDVAPYSASRAADGSEITFNLSLLPGGVSDNLIIYTNAKTFGPGNIDIATSLLIFDPPAFGPTASVTPEPSSLILLGTGALGLAGACKRRFLYRRT